MKRWGWHAWGWVLASCALVGCGGDVADGGGSGGTDGADEGLADDGSSGGSIGTGGSGAGGGGVGGSGVGGNTSCGTGQVVFEFTTLQPKTACTSGCSGTIPTVTDAAGNEYSLSSQCTTTCEVCQPLACTGICPEDYFTNGLYTFTGNYYTASTCGAQSATCMQPHPCMSPGRYRAEFCATHPLPESDETTCQRGERYCTTVEFDWGVDTDLKIPVDMTPP